MICSGCQLNAFVPLFAGQLPTIEAIIHSERDGTKQVIQLSPAGICVLPETNGMPLPLLQYQSLTDWLYQELVNNQPIIHIIGGGHVGLALSEMMHFLGFYVIIYDDRADLTTLNDNSFANEKRLVNYATIGELFTNHPNDYVAIMTVGYRTDKLVLQQLLDKKFFYLGLMGSQTKVKTLFTELEAEGYNLASLNNIFTPIGINILSKTTREIAVSIAGEIIRKKNKDLPTGRV
jgi:xanthine dehydrogenase accessory factor